MKLLSRILLVLVSVLYPLLVFGGLLVFKASPRVLSFGLVAILVVQVLSGAGQARTPGFSRLRLLGSSALILVLVALVWITDSLGLVKLYPILMNLFLLGSFASTLWRGPTMIFRLATLQDRSISGSAQEARVSGYCRRVTQVWCGFFVVNALLSLATLLWADDLGWTLYNGLISYVCIGALFALEFLVRILVQNRWMNRERTALAALQPQSFPPGQVMAFDTRGQTLTWAGFVQALAALGKRLAGADVQGVVLHTQDTAAFLLGLLAAWQAGLELILPAHTQEGFLAGLPAGRRMLLVDGSTDTGYSLDPQAFLEAQMASPAFGDSAALALSPGRAFPDIRRARVAFFTSGSTGEAKLVWKGLPRIQAELDNLVRLWGPEYAGRRVYATVSHQHFYGFLFCALLPFSMGIPLCRQRFLYPENLRRVGHEPLVLVGSPAFYKRLGPDSHLEPFATPPFLLSSGGALPEDAAVICQTLFATRVREVYGSTETGGIAWRSSPGDPAWHSFRGIRLKIDAQGGILVASPYLEQRGFVATGDAGTLERGGLKLHGRMDSLVKVEEKRVSLTEVEGRLRLSALVQDAAVILVQTRRQELGAVVVPSPRGWALLRDQGRREMARLLREHLGQYLEALLVPRRFRYLESLPYNAQGKLSRSALAGILLAPVEEEGIETRPRNTDNSPEVLP